MSETSWGRRKFRTANWKAYNAAVRVRGDLSIWLDRDIQWLAPPAGKCGRYPWSGYHRRLLVETKMNCFKRLGEKLMARTFEGHVADLNIRASILNQFTALCTSQTVAAA